MKWTSHPLVDVGIATLCAMASRERPEDLTAEDLDVITEELAEVYFGPILVSYLSCVFTMNSYCNPTMGVEKQALYKKRILKAYQRIPDLKGFRCVFSGEPAVEIVHRGQIPMLTGKDTLNFFPAGTGGIPIAGTYLTAIQALPMGCKRVEGRMLVAHSDVPELTLSLAKLYVQDNRRLIALAKAGKIAKDIGPDDGLAREIATGEKYPDSKSPGSLIAWDLMTVVGEARSVPGTVNCYWLSNSGQGASLDLFYMPSNLVRFLALAGYADYREAWNRAVAQAWRSASKESAPQDGAPKRKKTSKPSVPGGPGRSRNDLLDDLIRIYRDGRLSRDDARSFVRRHLLQYRRGDAGRPRLEQAEWRDWKLTQLFLKEVLGMTQERIDRIRGFADRLADHIASANDKKLFRGVVYSSRAYELRNALIRAQHSEARDHNTLLFGLADYLDVFESEDMVRLGDWSLTRDLISIRLVENLHGRRFFEKNADLLEESSEAQVS